MYSYFRILISSHFIVYHRTALPAVIQMNGCLYNTGMAQVCQCMEYGLLAAPSHKRGHEQGILIYDVRMPKYYFVVLTLLGGGENVIMK